MRRWQVVPDRGHLARGDDALGWPGGHAQMAIHQRRRSLGRRGDRLHRPIEIHVPLVYLDLYGMGYGQFRIRRRLTFLSLPAERSWAYLVGAAAPAPTPTLRAVGSCALRSRSLHDSHL